MTPATPIMNTRPRQNVVPRYGISAVEFIISYNNLVQIEAINMTPWNPENAITEPDLELAAKKEAVKKFYITQCTEGFYITVRLNWRDDDIHLATRRERDKPKMFKHIGRLIEHIRAKFPNITFIQLHLLSGVQTIDGLDDAATKKRH